MENILECIDYPKQTVIAKRGASSMNMVTKKSKEKVFGSLGNGRKGFLGMLSVRKMQKNSLITVFTL